jgi:hypothetical protein
VEFIAGQGKLGKKICGQIRVEHPLDPLYDANFATPADKAAKHV